MRAKLKRIEQLAPNIKTFWFRPEKPVNNVPGQFTELYLPHDNPDARGQRRWFTVFSSPTEELMAITTKFSNPSSTYMTALQALKPGTTLHFAEPMGDFILPKDKTLPLVFIAAGIGITPFRSITKWLSDTGEQRNITLIYAESTPDKFIETGLFNARLTHTHCVVSQPTADWSGLKGRLSADLILSLAKPQTQTLFYLSGPEILVEKLTNDLRQTVPPHHVITDFFPGYAEI